MPVCDELIPPGEGLVNRPINVEALGDNDDVRFSDGKAVTLFGDVTFSVLFPAATGSKVPLMPGVVVPLTDGSGVVVPLPVATGDVTFPAVTLPAVALLLTVTFPDVVLPVVFPAATGSRVPLPLDSVVPLTPGSGVVVPLPVATGDVAFPAVTLTEVALLLNVMLLPDVMLPERLPLKNGAVVLPGFRGTRPVVVVEPL
jgi:hypothetical protein